MKKLITGKKKKEASKRGKRSKNKGATYERKIANTFKTMLGIELTRTPQSGGFAKKTNKAEEFKGDLTCLEKDKEFLLHVETKNQKSVAIRKWIKQADNDCPKGKIPIVVYYLGQQIKDGHVKEEALGDFVTLRLEDFLALCDFNEIVKELNKDEV